MIRRIFLTAAAAVALILAPTVAMAATGPTTYNAPGFSSTVSDSTPAVGQSVTVTLQGGVANANQAVTLTITGGGTVRVLGATANASGAATFTTTFGAAGTYTLTMTNAAGVVLSVQTVTVHAAGAGSGAPLAFTGFDPTGLLVGGGLLVLAGAGAVVVARRRKSAQLPA
jgi:hypothetical protein